MALATLVKALGHSILQRHFGFCLVCGWHLLWTQDKKRYLHSSRLSQNGGKPIIQLSVECCACYWGSLRQHHISVQSRTVYVIYVLHGRGRQINQCSVIKRFSRKGNVVNPLHHGRAECVHLSEVFFYLSNELEGKFAAPNLLNRAVQLCRKPLWWPFSVCFFLPALIY